MAKGSTRSQKQSSAAKNKKKTGLRDTKSSKKTSSTSAPASQKKQVSPSKSPTAKASTSNPLKRAASAVGRVVTKLTARTKKPADEKAKDETAKAKASGATASGTTSGTLNSSASAPKITRGPRRSSDVDMKISDAYTPTQTSLKGPFRASGSDRERDQDFDGGTDDSGWNDEDRLTNKSGDPRIGTHNRTYEPAEQRAAKKSNNK